MMTQQEFRFAWKHETGDGWSRWYGLKAGHYFSEDYKYEFRALFVEAEAAHWTARTPPWTTTGCPSRPSGVARAASGRGRTAAAGKPSTTPSPR